MAYGDGDRGVGGWLAFFLVTLGVITPGFIIVTTLQPYSDSSLSVVLGSTYSTLMTTDLVMSGLMVALCWFAVWRFLKVFNWTTVKIGIGTLWTLVVLNLIVTPLVVSSVTGLSFGLILQAGGATMIRPIIYATIWTRYLLMSKRVRATYGGGPNEEVSQVFE